MVMTWKYRYYSNSCVATRRGDTKPVGSNPLGNLTLKWRQRRSEHFIYISKNRGKKEHKKDVSFKNSVAKCDSF